MEVVEILAKILRSLPPTYKHKVATIEQIKTIIKMKRGMLLYKLYTFEMTKFGDALPKVETAFKLQFTKTNRDMNLERVCQSMYLSMGKK